MKHIFLTIGLGIIAIGQLYAQNVSYYVGQSANTDPIMRHHEAFMDAFMQYVESSPKPTVTEGTAIIIRDTCRLQTVASITTPEGCESLTILIGAGPVVYYSVECTNAWGTSIVATNFSEYINDIRLSIMYENTSNDGRQNTRHNYFKNIIERTESFTANEIKSTSIDFKYECYDTERIVEYIEKKLVLAEELVVEFDRESFKEQFKKGLEEYKDLHSVNKADTIVDDNLREYREHVKEFLNTTADGEDNVKTTKFR